MALTLGLSERSVRGRVEGASLVWKRWGLGALCSLIALVGLGCRGEETETDLSGSQQGRSPGWVRVKAGSFSMEADYYRQGRGSKVGVTTQEATISRDFVIQSTEVTRGQFRELMGWEPPGFRKCAGRLPVDDCPVSNVSWDDAANYCNRLSQREGLPACYACSTTSQMAKSGSCSFVTREYPSPVDCPGYRLPTEAEWEYAARAGVTTERYGDVEAIAWHTKNSNGSTHPVGLKAPNAWGLYDALGNVEEWCHDIHAEYQGKAVTDPWGPERVTYEDIRVLRGGSWFNDPDSAKLNRRSGQERSYHHNSTGFRPAKTVGATTSGAQTQ